MLQSFVILLFFSSLISSTIRLPFSQTPLVKIEDYQNIKNPTDQYGPSLKNAKENGNHIFNTLHSAMRQWGSSYHHNGMSVFPATVPAGINLYHGGHDKERVIGMEWLAFEVEHAENFARSRAFRDGDRDPNHGGPPPENHLDQLELLDFRLREASEDPSPPWAPPRFRPGYLHIYRTNRPLNLIYIDGMGAAKSPIGTLDTQDILLLNSSTTTNPMRDMERGRDLCSLSKLWNMPIDGFIRMEAGFEIIHCDFSSAGGLDLIEARKRPELNETNGISDGDHFEYMRAVSMRYHGIDASRVELKFDAMISAYFYPANLTNPDPERQILPRLPLEDIAQTDKMRQDLKDALANIKDESHEMGNGKQKGKVDWQGMVDMIVTRYADRLQFIASNPGYGETLVIINVLLNTFINYEKFNKNEGIEKCTKNYFRPAEAFTRNKQDYLLGAAVLSVSRKICETLFDARKDLFSDLKEDEKTVLAVERIRDLIEYLDWSVWKECGKCPYDEVCFISMWPFGSAEDHLNPKCKNRTALAARPVANDYWGFGRGR